MPSFVATINIPGYLPMDDDPPTFDTAKEAWRYLAEERRGAEDEAQTTLLPGESGPYSETVDDLDAKASGGAGVDTVYGSTPGYDGDHDLGLAYCVTECEVPA